VRYHRISRLLHTLGIARQDGSLTKLLRTLAKTKLLILDCTSSKVSDSF